ncbi:MAG TPA: DUF5684 domain-containing protein [Opitutales bacterium]|nr:DUF5684 domain-containing protein [Opitutales bacterium]
MPNDDTTVNAAVAGVTMIVLLAELVILLITIVGMWRVFTKAGQPGWAVIIPIYNLYVLITIAGKPWWWIFLFLIPIVSLVMAILVNLSLAEKFGLGAGYGVGLTFLPFIFYPMLGFGSAQYQGATPPPI